MAAPLTNPGQTSALPGDFAKSQTGGVFLENENEAASLQIIQEGQCGHQQTASWDTESLNSATSKTFQS